MLHVIYLLLNFLPFLLVIRASDVKESDKLSVNVNPHSDTSETSSTIDIESKRSQSTASDERKAPNIMPFYSNFLSYSTSDYCILNEEFKLYGVLAPENLPTFIVQDINAGILYIVQMTEQGKFGKMQKILSDEKMSIEASLVSLSHQHNSFIVVNINTRKIWRVRLFNAIDESKSTDEHIPHTVEDVGIVPETRPIIKIFHPHIDVALIMVKVEDKENYFKIIQIDLRLNGQDPLDVLTNIESIDFFDALDGSYVLYTPPKKVHDLPKLEFISFKISSSSHLMQIKKCNPKKVQLVKSLSKSVFIKFECQEETKIQVDNDGKQSFTSMSTTSQLLLHITRENIVSIDKAILGDQLMTTIVYLNERGTNPELVAHFSKESKLLNSDLVMYEQDSFIKIFTKQASPSFALPRQVIYPNVSFMRFEYVLLNPHYMSDAVMCKGKWRIEVNYCLSKSGSKWFGVWDMETGCLMCEKIVALDDLVVIKPLPDQKHFQLVHYDVKGNTITLLNSNLETLIKQSIRKKLKLKRLFFEDNRIIGITFNTKQTYFVEIILTTTIDEGEEIIKVKNSQVTVASDEALILYKDFHLVDQFLTWFNPKGDFHILDLHKFCCVTSESLLTYNGFASKGPASIQWCEQQTMLYAVLSNQLILVDIGFLESKSYSKLADRVGKLFSPQIDGSVIAIYGDGEYVYLLFDLHGTLVRVDHKAFLIAITQNIHGQEEKKNFPQRQQNELIAYTMVAQLLPKSNNLLAVFAKLHIFSKMNKSSSVQEKMMHVIVYLCDMKIAMSKSFFQDASSFFESNEFLLTLPQV